MPQNTLKEFVDTLQSSTNIERKKMLFPIMDRIKRESFHSDLVHASMGEDSAAVMLSDPSDENLVLMTTDAINEKFSNTAPWSAGFSSILVGIEDIYACGGKPIAASVIISSDDKNKRKQLLDGVIDGTNKFKTPLVRGHTSDHTKNVSVSATIIGTIKKSDYISAGGAKPGDKVMILSDFDGVIASTNNYYWDTVTKKEAGMILKKRKIMNRLAELHIINASKDVSNSGIFGTLLLMAQYSQVGATVNMNDIRMPQKLIEEGYSVFDFSQMYLTTAFLVSVPSENVDKVHEIAHEQTMNSFTIGDITEIKEIWANYNEEKELVFDIKNY